MLRAVFLGLIAAALAAGAWWLAAGQLPDEPAASPTRPSTLASATAIATANDVPAGATKALPAAPAARPAAPPGLTPEQWALVLADLQARPDAAAERRRLEAYFTWSDAVRRWRGQRDDAALAAEVDAGLPDRLARREVSAAEARQLKAALLITLEPDPGRRRAALQAFDDRLPAPAGPDPRQQAFARQQAALVAAWQTRPAAERDPQALARDLAALRRAHFSSPAAATGPPPAPLATTTGR